MNVIDLEILIPASPEFIWRFIGDLSAIPRWHEDVVSVSFLTTQREGVGARWRQSTAGGKDIVAEISAWYDTLGYEYRIIDGMRVAENQGRLRMQEVTDGTLVRWTFQYELRGMLGGLRNVMRHKRGASSQIQNSLRNLHQLIMQESGGISTHEAKASVREAPDVDERSAYQPRHASAFGDSADEPADVAELLPLAFALDSTPAPATAPEDSDTKPNPVVLAGFTTPAEDSLDEEALEDTRPVDVETLLAGLAPRPADPAPPPAIQPPALEPGPGDSDDRSKLSVFEIFGLQRPSENRDRAPLPEPAPEAPPQATPPAFNEIPPPAIPEQPKLAPEQERPMEAAVPSAPADCPPANPITGFRLNRRRTQRRLRRHR